MEKPEAYVVYQSSLSLLNSIDGDDEEEGKIWGSGSREREKLKSWLEKRLSSLDAVESTSED